MTVLYLKGAYILEIHHCNLNIHYTASKSVWDKLETVYQQMPYWCKDKENGYSWYGKEGKKIEVSIEPSGLSFYAKLPQKQWEQWITLFKKRASQALGFEVGEPEEGYEFEIYDEK